MVLSLITNETNNTNNSAKINIIPIIPIMGSATAYYGIFGSKAQETATMTR